MKALVMEKPATNTLPVLKDMDQPQAGPGEVLVKMEAAALNFREIGWTLPTQDPTTPPIALGTAWNVMLTKGQVKPGDTVLIHGIGGGVALFCLQIGAAMGARVIVTSGSDEKLARARELGAAEGINYRTDDVEARVMALTGGEGVDLVVDGVGKATLITSLKVAKPAGRVVRFGAVTGGTEVPSRYLTRALLFGHMANQSEFDTALRFVANTRLEPVIHAVYPLDEFATAYDEMTNHRQFGKIIFRIAEPEVKA